MLKNAPLFFAFCSYLNQEWTETIKKRFNLTNKNILNELDQKHTIIQLFDYPNLYNKTIIEMLKSRLLKDFIRIVGINDNNLIINVISKELDNVTLINGYDTSLKTKTAYDELYNLHFKELSDQTQKELKELFDFYHIDLKFWQIDKED